MNSSRISFIAAIIYKKSNFIQDQLFTGGHVGYLQVESSWEFELLLNLFVKFHIL